MLTIGGNQVLEKMPAGMVDLMGAKMSVCSWPVVEEEPDILDSVVEAGKLPLCKIVDNVVVDAPVYWGKTGPDKDGFCDVVVDAPEITEDIIGSLQIMGIIPL